VRPDDEERDAAPRRLERRRRTPLLQLPHELEPRMRRGHPVDDRAEVRLVRLAL